MPTPTRNDLGNRPVPAPRSGPLLQAVVRPEIAVLRTLFPSYPHSAKLRSVDAYDYLSAMKRLSVRLSRSLRTCGVQPVEA